MKHYCYKFQHKPHYGECTNKNVLLGPLDFKVKMNKSQCNEFVLHSFVICLTSLFTILGTWKTM